MKKIVVVLIMIISLSIALPVLARPLADPPLPGEIVINEIMQNPSAVSDTYGEWFEVYNASHLDRDFDGCVLSDNGTDSHSISSGFSVASGDYFVFCRNGDQGLNGGVQCDYDYDSFLLTNDDDEIILTCNVEINRVEYDGGINWPDPTGGSMSYSVPNTGDSSNNNGDNWADSSDPSTIGPQYGDGDFGTPGARNHDWTGPTIVTLAMFTVKTTPIYLNILSVVLVMLFVFVSLLLLRRHKVNMSAFTKNKNRSI